jgi:uncharacterized protein (DUF302 family)
MSKTSNTLIRILVGAVASTMLSIPSHAADFVDPQIRDVAMKHVIIQTKKSYAEVCGFIETKLGRLDQPMRDMMQNGQTEELREAAIRIIQNYGLSIHYVAYHGKVLALNGPSENLKTYYIGDILSASTMTRVVRAAGLYAPLRAVVYQNASGGTTIEYDQPSSLFGQFHNPTTDEMGLSLDERMGQLMHDAAS